MKCEAAEGLDIRGKKMIDRLDATHSKLRFVLAIALRQYSNTDLCDFIRDKDDVFRTAAARELHVRGCSEAFDAALQMAKDARHENREMAAFLLGQLGTPGVPFANQSYPVLCELMRDPCGEVRGESISAVGWLATLGKEMPYYLEERLFISVADPEASVRASLAYALLSMSGEKVAAALSALIADPNQAVREAAQFVLEAKNDGEA